MSQNLRYELVEVERLMNSVQDTVIINADNSNEIIAVIQMEIERIKLALVQEVFTIGDEQHLERYIQYHQQALIRLLDKVMQRLRYKVYDLFHGAFYQDCHTILDGLLSFIERHFTKYFDQDAKAPESYLAIVRKDVANNLVELNRRLLELGADPKIIEVVFYAMRKLVVGTLERHASYRMVIYVKDVQKEILRVIDNRVSNINDELLLSIHYLNYNSIRCFTHHTQIIASILANSETSAQKLEQLSLFLKKVNQAQVKPGIGYNHLAPALKGQISNYIIEEIDYLERLQNLAKGNSNGTVVNPGGESARLSFQISVAQFAYMIKVFIECKILQNTNTSDLLRFLSKLILTKRTENISYDSLRSKFYNVEFSTKESVRQIFLKLATYIEKN